MTELLVKNGQDRDKVDFFKRMREDLSEQAQRDLATHIGLEIVEPRVEPEVTPQDLIDSMTEETSYNFNLSRQELQDLVEVLEEYEEDSFNSDAIQRFDDLHDKLQIVLNEGGDDE